MADSDDVCVLVPTYNEAATIGEVIDGLREEGFEDVLVIDGHSSDDTREIAEERGARVVKQSGTGRGSGKGEAVREGVLQHIDAEYVLMLDGDGTYKPEEAHDMLEPLFAGRAEHVIGDRFANMESGAMTRLNRFGNRMINTGFHVVHGQNFRDILSGYRAFTRDSFERMTLNAEGFGIETELAVECARQGIRTEVVDITYLARPDESETNLRPFRDGGAILLTLYLRSKTHNPLFYFGSVGGISGLAGLFVGAWVGYEWFFRSVPHDILAMLAGVLVLLGVQLVMFGVLADTIVSLHREQRSRLERIAEETREEAAAVEEASAAED
ncbi:S-layer glycoprotein N-glycosyltransferase AglJ [Haloarchaeobius sp. HME9146]|uniref:S-layer glycoprotein N-glycosyltransferase AglJ n=1 Tax=Haloarchaeobius sp. HME9146 TaxID=2978732 RepID=UPI0021C0C77E|nr:S-layer glycoprotein N-glycosyltransferase AglJ [Haloarchaeobius sp. HME9146]MCT9097033.1 S-layer glycoprotein N-glycosyltransferase AglJ [Haloarchaeobius sp. HME9146]